MSVLTIHATNVTGLGACQVVVSFLEAIECLETSYSRIDCYVPDSGPVSEFVPKSDKLRVFPFKRCGPKALSRVLECVFPYRFFDVGDNVIVLGDVPLRIKERQLVLVHQPHLQYPSVNKWVGTSMVFRVMRALTRLNASYADRVIVQTEAMAEGMRGSYSDWAGRDCIRVIGQPPPSWFNLRSSLASSGDERKGMSLFYPAAGYPHKNHTVIEGLFSQDVDGLLDRLVLTVPSARFGKVPDWVSCVGRLNHAECLNEYSKADALVFPSVLESYGLPLVEAMMIGLPILAADLPYARVLCGDSAIYFNPESSVSLCAACGELKQRLSSGWRPDWSDSLERMPKTWTEVVQRFLDEMSYS
jgi:hypothetical protein